MEIPLIRLGLCQYREQALDEGFMFRLRRPTPALSLSLSQISSQNLVYR
jgi:hypothetical protein